MKYSPHLYIRIQTRKKKGPPILAQMAIVASRSLAGAPKTPLFPNQVGLLEKKNQALDAAPAHVGTAVLLDHLEVLVVSGALAVTQGPCGWLPLAVIEVATLRGGEDFDITTPSARHGVRLGAGVVDHGRQLTSSSVDKPVGDLIHLKTRLPHEVLLFVLCWVRMLQVRHEPGSQLVRSLLGQVSSSLPLLVVAAHSYGAHLSKSSIVLVRGVVSSGGERCSIKSVSGTSRQ